MTAIFASAADLDLAAALGREILQQPRIVANFLR